MRAQTDAVVRKRGRLVGLAMCGGEWSGAGERSWRARWFGLGSSSLQRGGVSLSKLKAVSVEVEVEIGPEIRGGHRSR